MRRRFHIALAVALVVLAGVIGRQVLQTPCAREPVCQGRRLGFWLESLYRAEYPGTYYSETPGMYDKEPQERQRIHLQATQAIRQMGTNALPSLIERLQVQDARVKRLMMKWANKQKFILHLLRHFHFKPANVRREEAVLGFEALGPLAVVQFPRLAAVLTNAASPDVRGAVVRSLGRLGPEARSTAPALFRATKDTNDDVRVSAVFALGAIRSEPRLTLPVLVAGLDDPSPGVRYQAAFALGRYGPEARPAVPALLRTLATNNAAPDALKQIDPEAVAKAGVK